MHPLIQTAALNFELQWPIYERRAMLNPSYAMQAWHRRHRANSWL